MERHRALHQFDCTGTQLLYNVSHELRAPLSAIKGFVSSLLQPDICFDAETRLSFLQTIEREADKLDRLIEELLTMSRIGAGTFEVKRAKHSVREIVDSVRDTLLSLTLRHHLVISVPDDLPKVMADYVRIGEVIVNLVDNAVKNSPENSEVNIGAHAYKDQVVISVADRGNGIPADLHEKIFEWFYRVEDKGSKHKPGTGLGLCICRSILEKHGGRIWVESILGKGAKFNFNLPAA